MVIAIIGTLASVVLASLNGARVKARDAKRVSDMQEVQKALQLYWLDNNGEYPAPGTPPAGSCSWCLSALTNILVTGNYLPSIPEDPTYGIGGSGYLYGRTTTKSGYVLMVHFEGDSWSNWCKWVIGDGTHGWITNTNYKSVNNPDCAI